MKWFLEWRNSKTMQGKNKTTKIHLGLTFPKDPMDFWVIEDQRDFLCSLEDFQEKFKVMKYSLQVAKVLRKLPTAKCGPQGLAGAL